MAEPDSILQLGIEAARDGNKEEARNLFRLLTRQEPSNAQAWLWLAGVAENREERQAALERVVELEPNNEMAVKGLQALGVRPEARHPVAPPPVREPELPSSPQPLPISAEPDPFADDDDPFAELDNLSDVMASDTSGPVRRTDVPGGSIGSFDDTAANERQRVPPYTPYNSYDDEETEPARRGVSPLLAILLVLVGIGVIGLLVAILRPDVFGGGQGTASIPPAQQTTLAATSSAPSSSPVLSGTTAATGETAPAAGGTAITATEPVSPTTGLEQSTVPPAAEQPTAAVVPTQAPAVDVSTANPAIVPPNTPLESNGWLYDFNQPTYAAPIVGPLGQYSPNNGRFVIVLIFAVNRSGQDQAIPDNFFVLKDAQGRVWEARPEVSSAYVVPGVNADLAQSQTIPADGVTRSVALIFDVAPDATNLVFFARSNPSQGWLVLQAV